MAAFQSKMSLEDRREFAHLDDIATDAWYELTEEQTARWRELGVQYEAEQERRRDWADDRYEDFRDED